MGDEATYDDDFEFTGDETDEDIENEDDLGDDFNLAG
jgi:hypothetical protein